MLKDNSLKIIDLMDNIDYLKEYIKLCSLEWGCPKEDEEMTQYVEKKLNRIKTEDKVISVIGLIKNNILIGFISLFKYDGDECKDLTPWYATMYVKRNYRGYGYSKILNNALLEKARNLNYKKVYLKTNLKTYYENFGAKYIKILNNGEKLYVINL